MKRLRQIAALALACALLLCACGKSAQAAWQEQYDLGVKYLEEGSWEEAIIAFTAAIEIDPKRPEAYEGAARAYESMEKLEEARALLERALEQVEDEELRQLYLRLRRADDPFYSQLSEEEQALLSDLTAAVLAEDWSTALAIQSGQACQALAGSLPENEAGDRLSLRFYPDDQTLVSFFRGTEEGPSESHMDIYRGSDGQGSFIASVYSPEHYYMNVASFTDGAVSGPMTSYIHHVQENGEQFDFTITGNIQNGAPEGTLLYTYSDGSTAEQPPEGYDSWPDWPAELSR